MGNLGRSVSQVLQGECVSPLKPLVGVEDTTYLPSPQVAAPRCFLFLWAGASAGLDEARACLAQWGFRRCEDICWVRTNTSKPQHCKAMDANAVFQQTKVSVTIHTANSL